MKKQELKVKDTTQIIVDKKTNAHTLAIPFKLPDTSSAILMISRLKNEMWKPNIKSITINYNEN